MDGVVCFFMMWPTQWYNFCTLFPLEVGAVGLFLFLRALLVLSALPYFPDGQADHLALVLRPDSEWPCAAQWTVYYTCLLQRP